jgi:putative transposase
LLLQAAANADGDRRVDVGAGRRTAVLVRGDRIGGLDSQGSSKGLMAYPIAEICRKAGISQATYFHWKKKYDGLLPSEMRRLKQLEDENAKLRKVVADLSLDKEMFQDALRRKL